MKAELTAIIEPGPSGGYWAICPEVPGANGKPSSYFWRIALPIFSAASRTTRSAKRF